MNCRFYTIVVVFLAACLCQSMVLAASDNVKIRDPGSYQLMGQMHKKGSIAIRLMVSSGSSTPYAKYLGTWGDKPKTILTNLQIQINGVEIGVPQSAYSDLSNPTNAILLVGTRSTRLVIEGGDASEAYKVVMVIGNEIVASRKVYGIGGSGAPIESSVYSIVELKDE